MKHSNVNMNKPTTSRINFDLSRYQCYTKSKRQLKHRCTGCQHEYTFNEAEIKDQILKCPECGKEDIFFRFNY